MTVTLVQTAAVDNLATITFGAATSQNLLVLVVMRTAADTSTIGEPFLWDQAVQRFESPNRAQAVFWKVADGGETSATVSNVSGAWRVELFEFAASAGTWGLGSLTDSGHSQTGSATTLVQPSTVPAGGPGVAVSGFTQSGGTTGLTLPGWTVTTGTNRSAAYRLLSTAADPAATWSWTTARSALTCVAVFNPTPDPPSPSVTVRPRLGTVVYVRDSSLRRAAVVNELQQFRFHRLWNQAGGWLLTVPTGTVAAQLLAQPGSGVVVEHDGAVIYTGLTATTAGGTVTAARRTIVNRGGVPVDTIMFRGSDDLVRLHDRIVVPPAGRSHATHVGAASTVAVAYIATQAGPLAPPERRIDLLDMPDSDPQVGGPLRWDARYSNLLETVADLGRHGFSVSAVGDRGRVRLELVATVDHSRNVVFGAGWGGVGDVTVDASDTEATAVYVAAQGEGAARRVLERSRSAGRRIEQFADRRDLPDDADLEPVAADLLDRSAGVTSVTVDVDPDGLGPRFGVDYRVGDIVSVDVPGARVVARVVGEQTELTDGGFRRRLQLGDYRVADVLGLMSGAVDRRRLSVIERI
jgi:hypothetical protein